MVNINVIKRNGQKEPFDISKIKKSIEFAVTDTDANQLELESKFDQFIKANIKTTDIQKNIIQHAVQLASPQNPEWLNVAGRAYAMDLWSNFKLHDKSFLEIVKYNIKKGEYTKDLLDFYSESDIEVLGKSIDMNRDLSHSYSSLVTVVSKYLGNFELNQHMHMVNAMRFGQLEPKESRLEFVKDVYDILSLRKLSLATPFMANIRKGGNVSSCFIISIEDDLDSIFDNVKRISKISKNGGGLGIFLGYIRAKGSSVNGYPNAAGTVVQWIKIINSTLVAVNQGGKRAGAGTVALPIWHNDILDFLDMQTEHGDPRLKAFDVFPQITVPDLFMERDLAGGKWITFCPFEVTQVLGIDVRNKYAEQFTEIYLQIEEAFYAGKLKVATEHNARELMKLAMRPMFETGMPYVAFTDTINAVNPNKYDDETHGITNVNLCTESFSNVMSDKFSHVCNLASINLANIDNVTTSAELGKVARLSNKLLDYGIELTNSPDAITKAHNDKYRTIGIGLMGLHDHLAKEFLNFGSLDYIREIAECVEYNAVYQSTELAKDLGSFTNFDKSMWATGELTARFNSFSTNKEKYDWATLQTKIDKDGLRNSQLTSPAPTTTTSIYQDASASVLPTYSAFFSEDNKQGKLLVASRYLKQNPLAYGKTFTKFVATEIIDIVSELQKFTDTGISMEWIFDQNKEDFKAKDLWDAIHYAHQKKIKAIYYIRSIKKNESLERKEADCVGCSG